MDTSMVTVKGQIVIPSKIRHRHRIKRGTRVCFIEQGEDIIIRPVTDDYIDGLRGSLKTNGKALKALLEEKKQERALDFIVNSVGNIYSSPMKNISDHGAKSDKEGDLPLSQIDKIVDIIRKVVIK